VGSRLPVTRVAAPSREDPLVAAASEVVGGPHGRHSAGHPWWTPVRVVLAAAAVAWLLALVQKTPCVLDGWSGDDTRYARLCYSDVPYLYVGRGFAERRVPYADSGGRYPDLEYPVLTGFFAYGGAVLTQALHGWPDVDERRVLPVDQVGAAPGVEEERRDSFLVNSVLLAPFLLLTAWFLAGTHRGRPWDAMGFVVAPALIATGLLNWDLVAAALLAGAFWACARGRPVVAGVMIGLGTAAKLYPVFLLGPLLVVALRRRAFGSFAAATAAAVLAWLAVDVPVMLYGFDGWTGFWRFNAERGPDLGSLWLVAQQLGHTAGSSTINLTTWLGVAAVSLAVLVLGLRAPEVPRVSQLMLLVLLGFLVVNKVYSPQYVLWLLPVAALARPRWRDLLVWQAGEVFYFAMVWFHLGGFTAASSSGGQDVAYAVGILVRVAAELWLAGVVVRDVLDPEGDPVRAWDPDGGGPGQDSQTRSNVVVV
jgi:uncharacterized membrane protein